MQVMPANVGKQWTTVSALFLKRKRIPEFLTDLSPSKCANFMGIFSY